MNNNIIYNLFKWGFSQIPLIFKTEKKLKKDKLLNNIFIRKWRNLELLNQ